MTALLAGPLRYRIRIERPVSDDTFDGAGSAAWPLVCEVAAEIVDMMPGRGERETDGINLATRPARVSIRYRNDLTARMRVLVGRNTDDGAGNIVWQTDRTAQIVTVPAELGFREGLQFMIEDYSTAGNGA